MIQLKGCIPSPIHIHGKIGKALPTFFTVTFKDGYNALQQVQVKQGGTAVYNGTVPPKDGNEFLGWSSYYHSNPIVDSDDGVYPQQITNVQENIERYAVYSGKRIIHDSWDVISQRSTAGTASNYYNVGDMKRIHIEGTVGTLEVNQDVYVYILGFDHNSELEGSGITFGCFKDVSTLKDIAIYDSYYNTSRINGTKAFNMNHWGNSGSGGWQGCDARYDILGSTDIAPQEYGTNPWGNRKGYNATSTCATNPVANTLMSCLPSDLRAVMKPITKYTDSTSNSNSYASNVEASVDYLPLLSEFEIYGVTGYANQYEADKQLQYAYFAAQNSKVKYKHSNTSVINTYPWWERSPYYAFNKNNFCIVDSNGNKNSKNADYPVGIAPIFLV